MSPLYLSTNRNNWCIRRTVVQPFARCYAQRSGQCEMFGVGTKLLKNPKLRPIVLH